jgi:hypothetical protein
VNDDFGLMIDEWKNQCSQSGLRFSTPTYKDIPVMTSNKKGHLLVAF